MTANGSCDLFSDPFSGHIIGRAHGVACQNDFASLPLSLPGLALKSGLSYVRA